MRRALLAGLVTAVAALLAPVTGAAAGTAPLKVTWMRGATAPGTPARYDKVGVLRIGARTARNVLVLEPGTSAGSAYFAPLARWIVSRDPGWQVWAVERRENLLEDQSVLDQAKRGQASATQLYDYYLGYLQDPSITSHIQPVPDASVPFAKRWGIAVAVDLHFPTRLTLDLAAIGNGTPSPAQRVLGLHATLGAELPHSLRIYGFGARLGGAEILAEIRQLARQSGIPSRHLTLIDRHASYAHNDPAGAYPRNVFFSHLVTFLHTVAR